MTIKPAKSMNYFTRQFIDSLHFPLPAESESAFTLQRSGVSHVDAANSRAKNSVRKYMNLEAMKKFKADSVKLRADIARMRADRK